jgi:hypothetical protein
VGYLKLAKKGKCMYKRFGVFVFAAVFCLAFSVSYGQEPADDSASKTVPGNVAQSQEHVRHMRAHKRPGLASGIDQNNETPESKQVVAKEIEGGSSKARKATSTHAKSNKTKLQAHIVRSKVAPEKAAFSHPATPSETRSPKPSGFFEELFNQD